MRMKKRVWKKRIQQAMRQPGLHEFGIPRRRHQGLFRAYTAAGAAYRGLFRVYTAAGAAYLGVGMLDLAMSLDRRGDLNRIWGGGAPLMWLRSNCRRLRISELGGAAAVAGGRAL